MSEAGSRGTCARRLVPFGLAMLLAGPAMAGEGCHAPEQPFDQVVCANDATIILNENYKDAARQALAAIGPASRPKLAQVQKQWVREAAGRCNLPEKGRLDAAAIEQATGCVMTALRSRTGELAEITLLAGADPDKTPPAGRRSWNVPPYRLVIDPVDLGGESGPFQVLTIMEGRDWVYSQSNMAIAINPTDFFKATDNWEDGQKPFEVGQDVLGFGVPSLAVSGFSMGAHCCFDFTVLLLGPEFRALPTLPVLDNDVVAISRQGSGPATLALYDFTFAYWRASFASSAAPAVMLTFDPVRGQYGADPALMRRPAPTREVMAKLIADARSAERAETDQDWPEDQVPRELSGPLLDMIYGGNLRQAQEFLEKAWAAGDDKRADYWRELTTCRLRKSPFWPTVAALNNLPADKPEGSCD